MPPTSAPVVSRTNAVTASNRFVIFLPLCASGCALPLEALGGIAAAHRSRRVWPRKKCPSNLPSRHRPIEVKLRTRSRGRAGRRNERRHAFPKPPLFEAAPTRSVRLVALRAGSALRLSSTGAWVRLSGSARKQPLVRAADRKREALVDRAERGVGRRGRSGSRQAQNRHDDRDQRLHPSQCCPPRGACESPRSA